MAIRRTFYTAADAFTSVVTAEEARAWVRSIGFARPQVPDASGRTRFPALEELDEEQLARWVATATTSLIRSRARAGKSISVRRDDDEWVSILADRVDAVGARVVEDEEVDPWAKWTEDVEEPVH